MQIIDNIFILGFCGYFTEENIDNGTRCPHCTI